MADDLFEAAVVQLVDVVPSVAAVGVTVVPAVGVTVLFVPYAIDFGLLLTAIR